MSRHRANNIFSLVGIEIQGYMEIKVWLVGIEGYI